MDAADFLDRLDGVRRSGKGWQARCPAHDDRSPSLSIAEGDDGRILVHCHAGCDLDQILDALDLTIADLFSELLPSEPTLIGTTRYELRWEPNTPILARHVRRDYSDGSKRMHWERPDGTPKLGDLRTADLPLYGLDRLNGASIVVVTEGEKAGDALIRLDMPAVATVTGADGTPSDAVLQRLIGRQVYLWPDNDLAGKRHMARIGDRLRALGCEQVHLMEWLGAPAKGDAADYIARGATVEDVRSLVRSAKPYAPASDVLSETTPAERSSTEWPAPPADAAYHGLAGEIVRAIDPTTEADPVGVLLTLLAAVGCIVGNGPHWHVSGTDHRLRVWPILVGATAKGRKGTAWGSLRPILRAAAPDWWNIGITQGLSSGEGLIWAVRDPITKTEPVKEKNRIVSYQEVTSDPGITDKRLLVLEEEFASTLRLMGRDGNSLSGVLRRAWDDGDLGTLTKNSPARATGAHIVIVGHTTQDELLRYLDSTEAANGFANRFVWACVRRSKQLPDGGTLPQHLTDELGYRLGERLRTAAAFDLIERDEEASILWRAIYGPLSDGGIGLMGAVLSRAEAQVMRIASLYAILDGCDTIRHPHLSAAVALWDYLEASARYIFGDTLGDPIADTILRALRAGSGLDRTDISNLFGRHVSAGRLDRALGQLYGAGKVRREQDKTTGGRAREVWYAR